MATVAQLAVQISADLKSFNEGMSGVTATLKKTGDQFKSAGKSLTVGLTAPLVALGAKSLQVFNQQQQALAQVEAAVKSTAGAAGFAVRDLEAQATALQKNTIFGDEQILKEVTANLLTFTRITGDEFTKTQGLVLDLATRMGTDLTSATIQLGKALNDPVANLGALGRAGIQFTKEQKEVIKSLVEGGKQAEAQRIILDELETQFGGAAEAAAQAGLGGFKQLQNSAGDLLEEFGALIAEALLPLAQKIRSAIEFVSGLDDTQKRLILTVSAVVAAIGPMLAIIGSLLAILPSVISGFGLVKVALATLSASGGPIFLTVGAIAALVAGITALYTNWDEVTAFMQGAWLSMKLRIMGGITELLKGMSSLFDWIPGAESLFSGAIKSMEEKTGQAAVALANFNLERAQSAIAAREETSAITESTEAVAGYQAAVDQATSSHREYVPYINNTVDAQKVLTHGTTQISTAVNDYSAYVQQLRGDLDELSTSTRSNANETINWVAAIRAEGGLSNAFKHISDKLGGAGGILDLFSQNGLQGMLGGAVSAITGGKGLSSALTSLATVAFPGLGPAIGIATGLMKTFGIDSQQVMSGIASAAKSVGTAIGNMFGRASKEQKKARALDKFISDVARLNVDLSNLSLSDKKSIQALMTPLLTSGVATTQELLATLGLAELDMTATISDVFGGLLQASIDRGGDAMSAGIEALLNDVGSSLGQQFGLDVSEVYRQLFEFLGINMEEAQKLAEEMRQRQRDRERGVDPDGETGVVTTRPTTGAGVDVEGIGRIGGTDMSGVGQISTGIGSIGISGAPTLSGTAVNPNGQTININLDGQTIATATVPYMANELEVYGTNY